MAHLTLTLFMVTACRIPSGSFSPLKRLTDAGCSHQARFAGRYIAARLASRLAAFGGTEYSALALCLQTRGIGTCRLHRIIAPEILNGADVTALIELRAAFIRHLIDHAVGKPRAKNRRLAIRRERRDDAGVTALRDDAGRAGLFLRGGLICRGALWLCCWGRRRDRVALRRHDLGHHHLDRVLERGQRRRPFCRLCHRNTCTQRRHDA